MSIKVSGTIEVRDNTGQTHKLNGTELTRDEHLDGTTETIGHDTGDWAIEIDVENKNGAIEEGDWVEKNCKIIKNDIDFQ